MFLFFTIKMVSYHTKNENTKRGLKKIKNDCDQETGKEYSTIVQIIAKDDRGKALA